MGERLLKAFLGLLLVVAGAAMLVLPGPGTVFILGGVALMLVQWPRGRRFLARLRVRLRERFGSPRVRQVERRLPAEVCPPSDTTELRAIADTPTAELRIHEQRGRRRPPPSATPRR